MDAEKIQELKDLLRVYSGLNIEGSLENQFLETYKSWVIKTGNNPYKLIDILKHNANHLREFVSDITINESYFFRNMDHFYKMENFFTKKLTCKNQIYILSVGCSNGCEPYSIAMFIHNKLNEFFNRINIIGVDISDKVIKQAKSGVYQSWYLRHTPDEYLNKYFIKNSEYEVVDFIKDRVTFYSGNILNYEESFLYDIIFCRNFLIYFDSKMISEITKKLNSMLSSNGLITYGNSDLLLIPKEDSFSKVKSFDEELLHEDKDIKNITNLSLREGYDIKLETDRSKKDESEIFKKGVLYIKSDSYKEAINEFEFILEYINPKNNRAKVFLAYSYYKLGDKKRAREILSAIFNQGLINYDSFLLNGIIYYEEGDFTNCLEEFRKALFVNPDSEIAWFYLGSTYEKLERYSSAVSSYLKSLSFIEGFSEDKIYPLTPEFSAYTLKGWIIDKLEKLKGLE